MSRALAAAVTALLCLAAQPARAGLALERIMADPDWIGAPVERPYWSLDGKAVYYALKRSGSPIRDLHRIDLADGNDHVIVDSELVDLDAAEPVFDHARRRAAFVRNGDVFVRELDSRRLIQITRSNADEASPQFSADDAQIQFRVGSDWFAYDFARALVLPLAQLKAEKDPHEKKPDDFEKLQLRLIGTLRQEHENKDALRQRNEALRAADPTRAPAPFYLGDDVRIGETALGPDGRWLLVVTTPKGADEGRTGKMPNYVTESGYEEVEDVRTRVGRNDPAPQTLWLLDLHKHAVAKLAYANLPGIHDDPLAAIRAENEKARIAEDKGTDVAAGSAKGSSARAGKADGKSTAKAEPKERALQVAALLFSRDGREAAVQLRAVDNKDRWIATVDLASQALVAQHRLHDEAWINWNFNEFGWLGDARSLWYVSEETGYAQLYVKPLDGKPRALTEGRFEISAPALSPDGRWFYVHANVEAPYAYDVYRVPVAGGRLERLSDVRGSQGFVLSPDGSQVLLTHSSSYVPAQLGVLPAAGGTLRALTDTRTADYKAMSWLAPEIVGVPSSHTRAPIWAKFYKPADTSATPRPIVLFVHGAGYTQNTHLQFPYYFREQMFHNLLSERGYLVLDMDYRASEGYGRDWRTAIYRNMGHPELEDLIDGVDWLVQQHNGDPQRVGVYGGSYGGFMTLMALFRAPEVFKAGAALRPVTDWTQYNHEYTSNILNTPQVDALAYRRSSPIEFADGLKGRLVICHGMIDDNVFFQDSVRLFQKLVELHKDDVELAPYPMERHAFAHADAWLDEYKRIFKLFETSLH